MAFKELGSNKDVPTDLPWANEYLECNPKDVHKVWDIRQIVFSTKGYVFVVDDWRGFVFKSAEIYTQVQEFVLAWHKSKEPSPVLQLMLTKSKPYLVVGYDEERKALWSVNEKYYHQLYYSASDNPDVKPTNPLPLPKSPTEGVVLAHTQEEKVPEGEGVEQTSQERGLAAPLRAVKAPSSTKTPKVG